MNDNTKCYESANDYFGVCPECGSHDEHLNVGRDHWFKCDNHKTKWNVGSNLFSGWRRETSETHQRNREVLNTYRDVKPAFADDDIRRKIEADVVIATDGNQKWAVVSLALSHRSDDMPSVIYPGLETPEAAECARMEAIGQYVDHASHYGPSEVPLEHFNSVGRVVRQLRAEGGVEGDLYAMAGRILDAQSGKLISDVDPEFPF